MGLEYPIDKSLYPTAVLIKGSLCFRSDYLAQQQSYCLAKKALIAMSQRRRNDRLRTFLKGRIYYNNKMSSADCLVRDFSGAGARLIFDSVIAMPEVVELYIAQREQTLPAQIRWRSDLEVGVTFEMKTAGGDTAGDGRDELLVRLMKLEEQIQSLQKVVKQLKASQGDKEDFIAVA